MSSKPPVAPGDSGYGEGGRPDLSSGRGLLGTTTGVTRFHKRDPPCRGNNGGHMSSEVFCIGSGVSCSDGPCGRLRRLVVDPNARTVTHLVVDVTHHGSNARLVPLGLAYAVAGRIQIRCTRAEFDLLDNAEETHLVYGTGGLYDSDR